MNRPLPKEPPKSFAWEPCLSPLALLPGGRRQAHDIRPALAEVARTPTWFCIRCGARRVA